MSIHVLALVAVMIVRPQRSLGLAPQMTINTRKAYLGVHSA